MDAVPTLRDGVFTRRIQVGWGDCDPAGIAYTARLPDFGLQTVDAWWREVLGYGWYEMNLDHGFGTPFVHLSFDFRAPVTARHGLDCRLKPVRLGTTSLEFDLAGYQDGTHCFDGCMISVFVDSRKLTKIPAPAEVRSRVAPLVAAEGRVRP